MVGVDWSLSSIRAEILLCESLSEHDTTAPAWAGLAWAGSNTTPTKDRSRGFYYYSPPSFLVYSRPHFPPSPTPATPINQSLLLFLSLQHLSRSLSPFLGDFTDEKRKATHLCFFDFLIDISQILCPKETVLNLDCFFLR